MLAKPKQAVTPADVVVNEVRDIRRRLWQRCGNDVRAFLQRLDAESPWRDVPRRRSRQRLRAKVK